MPGRNACSKEIYSWKRLDKERICLQLLSLWRCQDSEAGHHAKWPVGVSGHTQLLIQACEARVWKFLPELRIWESFTVCISVRLRALAGFYMKGIQHSSFEFYVCSVWGTPHLTPPSPTTAWFLLISWSWWRKGLRFYRVASLVTFSSMRGGEEHRSVFWQVGLGYFLSDLV